MRIGLSVAGVEQVRAELQGFSDRRIRAAVATALTTTANAIKAAEQREMRDSFDRPTTFTSGALYAEVATADRLQAQVGIKGQEQGRRSAAKWLRWQVYGGQRDLKAFEVLLRRYGLMPGDMRAVPGQAARLDAFGNMSRGQLVQILSQLRADSYSGSTRALPKVSAAEHRELAKGSLRGLTPQQQSDFRSGRRKQATIRKAYGRAGGRYVALPNGAHRGKLLPGVYLNEGRDFGAKLGFGATSRMRPVLIYVSKAYYEPERFDFYYVANRGAQQLGQNLTAALQRSALRKPGLGVR